MRYVLKKLGHREGALLKVQFDCGAGYADCFPWQELGDAALDEQLRDPSHPLIKRSLELARIDAEARALKVNLFENLPLPSSYELITLPCITQAPVVKIKMRSNPAPLVHFLQNNPSRVRLDFNNRLTPELFGRFLEQVDLSRIDYVEDPYPFDASWSQWPVKLAIDRDSHLYTDAKVDFFIVKPALQDLSAFQHVLDRVVVTSYLSHPVGTAHAIYQAAKWQIKNLCGLSTPSFVPGTGIGFDQYLSALDWRPL